MYSLEQKIYANFLKRPKKERKPGIFWASEVADIVSGRLLPKDFFKERKFDIRGAIAVSIGSLFDGFIKSVCGEYEADKSFEIELEEGCRIVGKLDLFKDGVPYEIKTAKFIPAKPYENHKMQCECYMRGMKAEKCWITYILKDFRNGFISKSYIILPDDKRWELIKQMVVEFHNKLKQL